VKDLKLLREYMMKISLGPHKFRLLFKIVINKIVQKAGLMPEVIHPSCVKDHHTLLFQLLCNQIFMQDFKAASQQLLDK